MSSTESPEVQPYDVLVVGAGLCGLAAARALGASGQPSSRPLSVTLIDKAKGPGGRLATRRMGDGVLDHGAQFFTVRSDAFRAEVDTWMADGIVEEWCRGFTHDDGHPRYKVAGGMNRLAKYLAEDLNVIGRQRAAAIIGGTDRWAVTYEGHTRNPDEADAIIATPPVPQTVELLTAGAAMPAGQLGDDLRSMAYHPVIAVLATLDQPASIGPHGALQQPDDRFFSFVADNQAKGISPEPALTVHLAHELSSQLWDGDDDAVLAHVAEPLNQLLGGVQATSMQVKRWRYATPVTPTDDGSLLLAEQPGPLVLAGDAFAGAKVEGAFLSGLDAAQRVLRHCRVEAGQQG